MIAMPSSLRLHINWAFNQFFYQPVLKFDICALIGCWTGKKLLFIFQFHIINLLFSWRCSSTSLRFQLMALMFSPPSCLCVGEDASLNRLACEQLYSTLEHHDRHQVQRTNTHPEWVWSHVWSDFMFQFSVNGVKRFSPGLINIKSVQSNQLDFQSSCSDRLFFVSKFVAQLLQIPTGHEITCTTWESVKCDMQIWS